MTEKVICPITGKSMNPAFTEIVLGKHKVVYYYCEESGLLKTEKPYWLDEAYQSAISDTDTGLVSRNIANSDLLEVIMECLALGEGKLLDVAGGYGLLTRLMRDKGFDCYTTDKYCENLFAKSFEPGAGFRAESLFAFEVLEHIEDPVSFMHDAFIRYNCKTLIFSTLTFAGAIPARDWWYYTFETGQHITFYQTHTLSLLADRLGCKYHMIDPGLHVISDADLSSVAKQILHNRYFRKWFSLYVRRKRSGLSRTWDDHLSMKEGLKGARSLR